MVSPRVTGKTKGSQPKQRFVTNSGLPSRDIVRFRNEILEELELNPERIRSFDREKAAAAGLDERKLRRLAYGEGNLSLDELSAIDISGAHRPHRALALLDRDTCNEILRLLNKHDLRDSAPPFDEEGFSEFAAAARRRVVDLLKIYHRVNSDSDLEAPGIYLGVRDLKNILAMAEHAPLSTALGFLSKLHEMPLEDGLAFLKPRTATFLLQTFFNPCYDQLFKRNGAKLPARRVRPSRAKTPAKLAKPERPRRNQSVIRAAVLKKCLEDKQLSGFKEKILRILPDSRTLKEFVLGRVSLTIIQAIHCGAFLEGDNRCLVLFCVAEDQRKALNEQLLNYGFVILSDVERSVEESLATQGPAAPGEIQSLVDLLLEKPEEAAPEVEPAAPAAVEVSAKPTEEEPKRKSKAEKFKLRCHAILGCKSPNDLPGFSNIEIANKPAWVRLRSEARDAVLKYHGLTRYSDLAPFFNASHASYISNLVSSTGPLSRKNFRWSPTPEDIALDAVRDVETPLYLYLSLLEIRDWPGLLKEMKRICSDPERVREILESYKEGASQEGLTLAAMRAKKTGALSNACTNTCRGSQTCSRNKRT